MEETVENNAISADATQLQKMKEKLQKLEKNNESLNAIINHADIKRTMPNISKRQEIQIKAMQAMQCPVVLQPVWEEEEVRESYKALKKEHQRLLREYLENGFDAVKAYKTVYKKDDRNRPHIILRNVHINSILKHFNNTCESDRLLISKKYREGMDADRPIFAEQKTETGERLIIDYIADHKIRIDASEKLAKLNGMIIDKSDHKENKNLNVLINPQVAGDLNQFLVASGQTPIIPARREPDNSIGGGGMKVEDD